MDTGTWKRIRELFLDALEQDASAREDWLNRTCAGEPDVVAEVLAMLGAHDGEELALERALATPADAAASDRAPGDRIGPWTLVGPLGTGGMGEVWLAERTGEFEQRAAVKLVRPGWRAAQLVTRFRRERQILARLEHPHIATLLDGGITPDGHPWLAMEYVSGAPVTAWCDARSLSVRERVDLFRAICDAVAFAHANLVIHRDLKPANILVTDDGKPILLDFGIAKLLDDDGAATRPDERLLTPETAAPEQLRGEAVSTATDVWALGALLYQLLAGVPPFEGKGTTDRETDPPPPSRRAGDGREVPGDLDAIVLTALRAEPERRYPTAQALAADLDRWKRGEPVLALPDSLSYRARKFVRRNRVAVSAAALVTMLLVAFAGLAAESARRLGIERDRAAAERDRAERIVSVMVELFETSNPQIVPGGDSLRVADFLEAAEDRLRDLDDQPAVRARLWQTMGQIHAARSRFDRARDANARALEAARAAGLDDLVRTLEHEAARLAIPLAGPAAAEPLLRASVARFEREAGDQELAAALQDLAGVVEDPRERAALLDRVLRIRMRSGDPLGVASARNALGNHAWEQRDYAAAAEQFRESLALLAKMLPPEHPHRLAVETNLASCELQNGHWERSLAGHRRVLAVRRRILGEDAVETAGSWSAVGIAQVFLGRAEEAQESLTEAARIHRLRYPQGHPARLSAERNLALARVAGGDPGGLDAMDALAEEAAAAHGTGGVEAAYLRVQAERARLLLGRAPSRPLDGDLAILEAEDPDSYRVADGLLVRAVAALGAGDDPAGAASDARKALEIRRRTHPAAHPAVAEARLAVAATGGDVEGPALDDAARAYSDWGLRIPLLLDRARGASR